MGLTATEKDYFRKRLNEEIEAAKTRTLATDPTWERDITKQAQEQVEKLFGVDKLMQKLEKLREAKREINAQIETVSAEIVSQMSGRSAEDVNRTSRYRNSDDEFSRYPERAADYMRAHCQNEGYRLKDMHPVGKALRTLQNKQTEVLDQITIASSHKQLEQIWAAACKELQIFDGIEKRQPRKVETRRKKEENEC